LRKRKVPQAPSDTKTRPPSSAARMLVLAMEPSLYESSAE
jgi:hypothetical protein